MTDPLDVARDLIGRGVPVFACPPGDGPKGYKLPTAWQTIKADPRRLDVYRPGYALCAVMGHGYDVIDRDPRNNPGPLPFDWPDVLGIATTPGGGEHYWITATGRPKAKLAQGWDLQAGTPDGGRGFVFMPGTAGYGWVSPPRPVGESNGLAGLWAHLDAARPATAAAAAAGGLGEPIPLGAHDSTLASYAASRAALGDDEETIVALVLARGHNCDPPWAGPDSLEHSARTRWVPSALRKFGGQERTPLPVAPIGFSRQPDEPAAAPGGPSPVDWHQAFAGQAPLEWVIPGIVPRGAGVVLYSPPGVGKSLLTLEWAVRAAQSGLIVTYVDQENDLQHEVVRRLVAMGAGPDDLGNLRFFSFPEIAPLDAARGAAQLVALTQGADLVVLDTISRMVQGEENSNDTWNNYYRHCGLALKAARIACLRLDHAGKDADRGQRGGSAKAGDVDIIWRLESMDDEQYSLKSEKNRMPIPEKWIVLQRHENPLRHEKVSASELDAVLALKRRIWSALEDRSAPADVPRGDAREILKAERITCSNDTLGKVLKAYRDMANVASTRPSWAPSAAGEDDGCLTWGGAPPPLTAEC